MIEIFRRGNRRDKVFFLLIFLSFLWLVVTSINVYLFSDGEGSHRCETAALAFIFVIIVEHLSREDKCLTEPLEDTPERHSGFTKAAFIGIPLLLWIILYIPFLDLPFLSDDYVFLFQVQQGGGVLQFGEFFRPVFNFVFCLLFRVCDFSPVPFHVFGFLLHIACSVLVFILSKRVFRSFYPAYFVAVLFLFNPVQAEAVVWVSGLQELLWTFFLLLAACFYIRRDRISPVIVFVTAALIFFALLSKETAVCFVLFFPLLELIAFGFNKRRGLVLTYGVYLGLLGVYFVLRSFALSIPSDFLFAPDFYFIKSFMVQPFQTLLYPWNQLFLGSHPFSKFVISMLVSGALFYLSLKRKISVSMFLSVLIIYAGTLPLLRMFYVAPDLQGSRYIYFSSFGWGMLIVFSLLSYIKSAGRPILLCFTLIVLLLMAYLLHQNLRPWQRAGEIVESLPANLTEKTAPDNYFGAYILRNGYKERMLLKQMFGGVSPYILKE